MIGFFAFLDISHISLGHTVRAENLGRCILLLFQVEVRFKDVSCHRTNIGLNQLAFHTADKDDVDRIKV